MPRQRWLRASRSKDVETMREECMRESAHAELVALAGPARETLGARSSRCCVRIYIVQLKSSYSVD